MKVLWVCVECGSHNDAIYPLEKDLSSTVATGYCFGLSKLPLFRTEADTIEAVGTRICKKCKKEMALLFFAEHPYVDSFSYELESDIGKKIVELLKERRVEI